MRVRRFRIAEHPDYGGLGLAPTWMAGAQSDPLSGMGVAHDILEHGPNDAVEWQGLGGSLYVRGLTGYFSRPGGVGNPSAVQNISGEFHNLFQLWEGQPIPQPHKTRPLPYDAESLLQAIIAEGKASTLAECSYSGEEAMRQAEQWLSPNQLAKMAGWMRMGYRACIDRWRPIDPYTLCETFIAIETAVDAFLKHGDDNFGEALGGMIAIVRFDPMNAYATVEQRES